MRKPLPLIRTICCLLICCPGLVEANDNGVPEIFIKRTSDAITLDGKLDEAMWANADHAANFVQHFPTDSIVTEYQSEVYMLYDDVFLYIGVKCYAPGDDYKVTSLKRDYRASGIDNITFMFDPFNDGANAYVFGITPLGVVREALITDGGTQFDDFVEAWDNKWDGAADIGDGFWTAELAIPFSTLRFNEGSKQWRFQSYRFDTQANEWTSWARIPQNQIVMNLAFMGNMIWEEPLKKSGTNLTVIPYASGAWSNDYEAEVNPENVNFDFGGDVKVGVTPGMNLDLTINPDFSQVEVDRQVTNLSRFEIFFPERRQFFTENADLFSGFGDNRINPFFSRRIGISFDTTTSTNVQNRILYGARLSGKLTDDWRLGLLNMTAEKDPINGLPTFNYSVLAVQRKVAARSSIGAIFVNKQALDPGEKDLFDRYNRTVGLDYNLASKDNKWTGKAFVHKVISVNNPGEEWSHGARLNYHGRKFTAGWSHSFVGENFNPQVGFVPRKNFIQINPEFGFLFYPEKGIFNNFKLGVEARVLYKPDFGRTDHEIELQWGGQLRDNGRFRLSLNHQYTYLFSEFDPTRTDAVPLPAESEYNDISLGGFYFSDQRRKVTFTTFGNVGEFFDGFRASLGGGADYRIRPYGSFGLSFNVNYIDLPEPHASATLLLIGPRIDITFSKSLFFSTLIQYNNPIDNMNINARFQWRFAPVSDFFLVYTDNYNTDGFSSKNRAIVGKVTYWLNL